MANDINEAEGLSKFRSMLNIYTPEYLKELAKESYKDDREYPENFSNWFYHILDFGKFKHADIISNQIFTFEEVEIMQETDLISDVNWSKLNEILQPTLNKLEPYKIYNIKNGCYSNKFDFDTCMCTKENLAEKFWKINYMSTMYETGGYTELVVREVIPYSLDTDNPTIYNGMPLREEIRVFYNFDTKRIEHIADYWNYDYCRNYMKNISDGIVFDWFHNKYGNRELNHIDTYIKLCSMITAYIDTLKFDDELKGIWSIDFLWLKETGDIYLIDMARGYRSAYWEEAQVKIKRRGESDEK